MIIKKFINIHNLSLYKKFQLFDNSWNYITSAFKPITTDIYDAYSQNKYQFLNCYFEQYTTLYYLQYLEDIEYIVFTGPRDYLDITNFFALNVIEHKIPKCLTLNNITISGTVLNHLKCCHCLQPYADAAFWLLLDIINDKEFENYLCKESIVFPGGYFGMPYMYIKDICKSIAYLFECFIEFKEKYSNLFNTRFINIDNNRLYAHIAERYVSYQLFKLSKKVNTIFHKQKLLQNNSTVKTDVVKEQ